MDGQPWPSQNDQHHPKLYPGCSRTINRCPQGRWAFTIRVPIKYSRWLKFSSNEGETYWSIDLSLCWTHVKIQEVETDRILQEESSLHHRWYPQNLWGKSGLWLYGVPIWKDGQYHSIGQNRSSANRLTSQYASNWKRLVIRRCPIYKDQRHPRQCDRCVPKKPFRINLVIIAGFLYRPVPQIWKIWAPWEWSLSLLLYKWISDGEFSFSLPDWTYHRSPPK